MALEVFISGANNDAMAVPGPAYSQYSMSFPSGSGFDLYSVSAKMALATGVPGTVYCDIYAADGDHFPTGGSLGTASINSSTFETFPSISSLLFTFSPVVTLTAATQYCFVFDTSSGSYNAHYIYLYMTLAGSYASGQVAAYDGSWHDGGAADIGASIRSATAAPTKATNPSPADDATDEDFSGLQLSWDDGGGSDTYNVYIGETGDLTAVSTAQVGTTYTTTMAELETIFGTDPIEQKIYWRVDATNAYGTTTGDEWDFDSRPAKASVPSPTNTATGTVLGLTTTWTGSDIADTFDTYANIGAGLAIQSDGLESATWTPTPTIFDYITEYTWRVDSTNAFGTTTGDEWTFTTLRFDPPSQTHFYSTTGQYYQLLVQDDGTYGDPPGTGVENTDYVFLAAGYEYNAVATTRRLVAAAENRIWFEGI